jgi:cation diffusion facilitator family transporter
MVTQRQKTMVAALSVASNTTLVTLKIVVGIITGSVSIISEGIHSGVDLIAAIIALFAVRQSGKPADEHHPFGHGKFENISGTVEALLIFVAAIWIIYEAIKKLTHPEPLEALGWGVGLMFFSAVANTVVSNKLFKIGKASDSVALQADAWHLRTDVYTSLGVMIGLAIVWIGEWFFPHADLHWVDPVAAIAVALLIFKAAYSLTIESARDLLDISLPVDEEEWIRDQIRQWSPTVRGFHKLRTRKSGSHRFIQFHLRVDAIMPISESHEIHDKIVAAIKERFPESMVTIHMEPCQADPTTCAGECDEGCHVKMGKLKKREKE